MQNVLFHTLKGINGLSKLQLTTIDVGKVIEMSWRRRKFAIFDQDHMYSLTIEYAEPEKQNVSPVLVNGHIGINIPMEKDFQFITKRYRTEEDCVAEINIINKKITALGNATDSLADYIMKKCQ